MSRARNGLLAVVGALLLTAFGCAGLTCSGGVGAGWWAATPRGQHFPSAVIVEDCVGAVWYRDDDDGQLSDMALRVLLTEMTRDGEFDGDAPPRWVAEAMFRTLMPRELVGCVLPDKRWVGAMNPATLPALWAPAASRILDEQQTFEVEGYRFTQGEDQIWGMVDGTVVMGSDEQALTSAVQALVADHATPTALRKEIAQLILQGQIAFVAREQEVGGKRGTGWLAVDSPDRARVQTTLTVEDTEEGNREAERMCDEAIEATHPAAVSCETTWRDGMRVQLDLELTGIDEALAVREAERPEDDGPE